MLFFQVQKLRQNERKQAAKMVKMENMHVKRENVLKRKVEEATMANKRLKDVIDKQKAAAKMGNGRGGLVGAGERVRNWVNEEVNVVLSVKEATQSRDVLINDRKVLTKELNALKEGMRGTMSGAEMEEHQDKMKKLKEDLQVRTEQISQLQKQIANLEEDNSKKSSRFDGFKTLTEAKIALEHLFDKQVCVIFAQYLRRICVLFASILNVLCFLQ